MTHTAHITPNPTLDRDPPAVDRSGDRRPPRANPQAWPARLPLAAHLASIAALALLCASCGGDKPTFANLGDGADTPDADTPDADTPGACASDLDCPLTEACCQGRCADPALCQTPQCQAQGEPCALSGNVGLEAQGDFYCTLFNSNPEPLCLGVCEKPFTADACAPGSFCLSVNAGEQALSLCLPGECATSRDCRSFGPDGGTCVGFGNRASFCFGAGVAPLGAPCTPGASLPAETCASDLFCVSSPNGATCQPLCDMWSGDGACPRDTACGFLTVGNGVCRPQTETGRQLAEACSPIGAWCDDGAQCLDFQTGGEPRPVCTAYCRPGLDDCRGRFQDRQGFCRTVFSDGAGDPVEDIGLCL